MKSQSLCLVTLFWGLFISAAALAEDSRSNLNLHTTSAPSVSLIGSGCALNSGANTHWEGGTLVVNFANMVAEKAAGNSLLQSRKNCSITLDLPVPHGISYALVGYEAKGHDELAASDTRTLTVTNFFQGQGTTAAVNEVATGARSGSFSVRHQNSPAETLWSPCKLDRAHTITAAIRLGNGSNRNVQSFSALDSLRLNFRIKPCN